MSSHSTVIPRSPICETDLSIFNASAFTFKFISSKLQLVNFTVQSVDVPGIAAEAINVPAIYSPPLKWPSTGLNYAPCTVTFPLIGNFRNYAEIKAWMERNSPPGQPGFEQYVDDRVDALLIPYDQATGRPYAEIKLENVFPISLTEISFNVNSSPSDAQNITLLIAVERYILKLL